MKIGEAIKCENCGRIWVNTSPPPEKAYEAARVHVDELDILLPKKVVEAHRKKNKCDSYSMGIKHADFCNIDCLRVFVIRYMKGEDVEAYHR